MEKTKYNGRMWRTIALSLGLYAFANLPWNEAILNNFLSETSCRKPPTPTPSSFCSPLGKCKIETENTFTRAIIGHVWKADTAVSGGEKEKREKRIFVAERMKAEEIKPAQSGACHGRQPRNKVMTFTVTDETATENGRCLEGNLIFNRHGSDN